MPLTERELGAVIDGLMTDFPGADRDSLDQAVHQAASKSPGDTANRIEQSIRMRMHLRHQGDH